MSSFFLSHAVARDTDGLIVDLFRDLAARVGAALQVDRREPVGFEACTDRPRRSAVAGIVDHVLACPVLVPLYSDRYFNSADCGRVVSAFVRRRGSDTLPPPIVPILWLPPVRSWPPVPALPVEVDVGRYNEDGLCDVMMSRDEDEAAHCYDAVLDEVVVQVLTLARTSVPPSPLGLDLDALPNAFARAAARPKVTIHVLAPDLACLPVGRDAGQYGPNALGWNPYPHETPDGLGARVGHFAGLLGYEPTLVAVHDIERGLPGMLPPAGPAVLLIDPWVLDNPKWRDRLLEFDRSERTWVSVLVAWNTGDPQTDRNRQRLLDQLNNTLENRFRRRRPGLQLNAHVTASLEDVATALPAVLQEAMHRWLRGRSTPRRSDTDDPPDEGDGRSR